MSPQITNVADFLLPSLYGRICQMEGYAKWNDDWCPKIFPFSNNRYLKKKVVSTSKLELQLSSLVIFSLNPNTKYVCSQLILYFFLIIIVFIKLLVTFRHYVSMGLFYSYFFNWGLKFISARNKFLYFTPPLCWGVFLFNMAQYMRNSSSLTAIFLGNFSLEFSAVSFVLETDN